MNDTYLAHHGILGQKWGVRRFQNPDGTRTAAGLKREQKERDIDHSKRNIDKDKIVKGIKIASGALVTGAAIYALNRSGALKTITDLGKAAIGTIEPSMRYQLSKIDKPSKATEQAAKALEKRVLDSGGSKTEAAKAAAGLKASQALKDVVRQGNRNAERRMSRDASKVLDQIMTDSGAFKSSSSRWRDPEKKARFVDVAKRWLDPKRLAAIDDTISTIVYDRRYRKALEEYQSISDTTKSTIDYNQSLIDRMR